VLDLTIALDDGLTERFPRCIDCLKAARHIDLAQVGGRVLAVSRCPRCVRQDPAGQQLVARLKERVGSLYQRTRQVLMAHQERPIYEFHW
jgi:hypothetical protein